LNKQLSLVAVTSQDEVLTFSHSVSLCLGYVKLLPSLLEKCNKFNHLQMFIDPIKYYSRPSAARGFAPLALKHHFK
jgi:hypothetical protein